MFHPVVQAWFERRFAGPTEAQTEAWPRVAGGRDVLITAPTGSGKTLAAFLMCIDRLVRQAAAGALRDGTTVVYVSPLKALSNDVRRNLEQPLVEIAALAAEMGTPLATIRAAVRTGDTSAEERRALVRKPPHILVTTPESLYILLTSESGRKNLGQVDTVIVDEIHAMVADKRGAHLALSLERLQDLVLRRGGPPVQRIGLSATVRPLAVAAHMLVGADRAPPDIINTDRPRALDLAIEVPRDELGAACTNEQWGEIYDRIAELARNHRSTLVFVNTRRLVERVAHNLAARLGETAVGAHHGSLSRERRFKTEQRLKAGDLQVVVATASLELGIDVGAVDLVCLVGSPRTIATGLQRIGRSGHAVGGTPRGRFFPLTRDQLLECAALVRAARAGALDHTAMRNAPLDILAQQIVAACACDEWDEDALYAVCRRAAPYQALPRERFDAIVDMLAEGIATSRGRSGALLHRDAVNRRLRGRRGARLTALTSGGAIPDTALYDVVLDPEGTFIGTLDEDFAIESMAGDIVLLGNTSWRIRRIENGRVRVEDAAGAPPSVPFWFGEGPARSLELSAAVGELREALAARIAAPQTDAVAAHRDTLRWLCEECALDEAGAALLLQYVAAGRAALAGVPSQDCVIAERFFDESGGTQLVIHAPFGGRINRAWGMALRKRFCRSFDFELQAAATDDGVLLSLGPQHSFPLEMILEMLRPEQVPELLTQAALQAPVFETRWRWNATRALVLRRHQGGKRVPLNLQRMRAQDLLAACFPAQVACQDNHGGGAIEVPNHPLVKETVGDCLGEAMDAEGLARVLTDLAAGKIRTLARETPEPSVFAHEILNANPYAFLDDAPLEERRSRAVSVRRGLPAEIADNLGFLDPQALRQVVAEAQPAPRDPDELHDLLLDLGALPEPEAVLRGHLGGLETLQRARRAGRAIASGAVLWVAAERLSLARAIWPDARFEPDDLQEPPARRAPAWSDRHGAIAEVVRGHMAFSFPVTARELAARLALDDADVEAALLQIELAGAIMRGRFTVAAGNDNAGETEWFDRRLLARTNQLTVRGLRQQIEAVSPADYIRFLLSWQHVLPGTQLHGRDGVLEVVAQLQGFEAAAAAWEQDILPARVAGYDPAWLDDLCLGGDIAWGRLAIREEASTPNRTATLAIVRRRDLPWLLAPDAPASGDALSSRARQVLDFLREAGASFLDDIVVGTRHLRTEIEDALRELVAAGWVTADGFAGLRALLALSGRRTGTGRRFFTRGPAGRSSPRLGAGRWALLRRPRADADSSLMPEQDERMLALARQFIRRYGVVFRDVLAREAHAPPWRDLVRVYRLLEMRGELRGGRLVASFVGEQFAAPEAVDALRATRRRAQAGREADEVVQLSACDPLNVVGILTPGARVPAQLNQRVSFRNGSPEPARASTDLRDHG